MREYAHLINNYLCINPLVIPYTAYYSITFDELGDVLHNLNSFESPDMYSVLEDKVIILEHFEFDSSKHSRKGMKGKQEESLLEKRIASAAPDSIFRCDWGNYSISLADWKSNFERIFDSHYNKISEYKRAVLQQLNIYQKKPVLVGFFIENQYAPIVSCTNRQHEELYYFETIQFAEKIADRKNLDFILFGGWYNQKPQIFYIDCKDCANLKNKNVVDLSDTSIQLSPLNNELTVYANFCTNQNEH